MARGCSPKGVVKKHSLYSKQPKDWGRGEEGRGGDVVMFDDCTVVTTSTYCLSYHQHTHTHTHVTH